MTASWFSGNQTNRFRRRVASRQPIPMPRKLARRMKLEKYASRRTYAGIQRISAVSSKRTRKDETKRAIQLTLWLNGCWLMAMSHQPVECQELPARFRTAARVAAAIAVSAAAAESARSFRLRTRLVDRQAAAAQLIVVQLGNGLLRLFVRAHLHEREPARPARGHVAHHLHRFDGAGAGEQVLQVVFAGLVRKISHVKSATHLSHSSVANATTVEVLVSSLSGISGSELERLVTRERQHSTGKTFTDASA